MDAPGTRYKVVERGRRLEVLDTWNGNRPVQQLRDPVAPGRERSDMAAAADAIQAPRLDSPPPIESPRAPRLDQRGRGLLHTKTWYDAKGPRQIAVTQAGEEKLRGLRIVGFVALFIAAVMAFLFWPLLFILPFFVLNEGTRKTLRTASTKFLDELNQPVTRSSSG